MKDKRGKPLWHQNNTEYFCEILLDPGNIPKPNSDLIELFFRQHWRHKLKEEHKILLEQLFVSLEILNMINKGNKYPGPDSVVRQSYSEGPF